MGEDRGKLFDDAMDGIPEYHDPSPHTRQEPDVYHQPPLLGEDDEIKRVTLSYLGDENMFINYRVALPVGELARIIAEYGDE